MMPRLGENTLAALAADVERPGYARARHGIGIVHLGLGAFARAHLAEYTDDALAAAGGDWRIHGVSMRSGGVAARLEPQDGLYIRETRSGARRTRRVINALAETSVLPADLARVLAALAAPATRLVTLTITEKGYCHDPTTGGLDLTHPAIVHDLAHRSAPASAIGLLVAGLAARQRDGMAPFAMLSCDNLADNGALLSGLVTAFAAQVDPALARWIADNAAFPSSMVDRIVPASTPADLAAITAATGVDDQAPVICEPFRQWVIEDRFPLGRPRWEAGGATLVTDVAPYERAKLRMLNAAHSTLAYAGLAVGMQTVAQAIAAPNIAALVDRLLIDEAMPSLQPTVVDLASYRRAILDRFANPALDHRLAQIATDGSQKLPPRLLATARYQLAHDGPVSAVATVVALFATCVWRSEMSDQLCVFDDPLASQIIAAHRSSDRSPHGQARALLGIAAVFGDLAEHPRFVDALAAAFAQLP